MIYIMKNKIYSYTDKQFEEDDKKWVSETK